MNIYYTLLSTLSLARANFGKLPNAVILANLGIEAICVISARAYTLGDSSTSKPVVVAPGLPALNKKFGGQHSDWPLCGLY